MKIVLLAFIFQLSGKIKAVFGNKPGETIVHEANESKCCMVVLGCRGT